MSFAACATAAATASATPFSNALDVHAKEINDAMKIAAAKAIASFVTDEKLCPEYIIPSALEKGVAEAVAAAVAQAAKDTGVARI